MKDELFHLMALTRVRNLGSINLKKLLRHFDGAASVFSASRKDLEKITGKALAREIKNFDQFHLVDEEISYAERNKIDIISIFDEEYPRKLAYIPDSPVVLFKKGSYKGKAQPHVSIVGTRMMTSYGKEQVKRLITEIKDYNPVVVSGLAYGIDAEAHRQALEQGLETVAVMGTSFTHIYPSANRKLAEKIMEQGAVYTEYWSYEKTDPAFFLRRNRIVAGMSDATVVMESGIKGGSLTTAEMAFSYNRDVFALPGRVTDVYSAGCNMLIGKNVAQILISGKQMAEVLNWKLPQKEKTEKKAVQTGLFPDLNPEEKKIYTFLNDKGPEHPDVIALELEMPVSRIARHLMMMELKGVIRSLPGKRFEAL